MLYGLEETNLAPIRVIVIASPARNHRKHRKLENSQ